MEFYDRLISNFPTGITVAMAYGSGVFKQQHQSTTSVRYRFLLFVIVDILCVHPDHNRFCFFDMPVYYISKSNEDFNLWLYYHCIYSFIVIECK